ncbi:MAG: TonB-dependent receptor [Chitinophagaceae bacterium]|nr:TonB-dependent receptor [Chitinophagaceae bacterium]
MIKTTCLCFVFYLLAFQFVSAQGLPVTGRITTSTGEPAAGATVTVRSTNAATSADANGNYRINVPSSNSVLVFTSVGMAPVEMTAGTSRILNVVLQPSTASLSEVVVIGYGTQKKSVVTGAISSVKASDIDNQPIARIEQFLQGRASGLTIAASSGQPGAGSTLRVRGTTSINNSDPLYIVDGIPVDIGGIDYLNPNDIESIEVLKDAASAAIYGARAASGVILVTTKKGRAGRTLVSYNGYYGTQAPAHKLDLLNATEYATLQNEASLASGGAIKFANPSALGVGTDWQSIIFNNSAKIQDHEISISGGNDRSTFYTSFGLFNQEGIVAPEISSYKRFNFRMNANHKINNWLNIGTNLGYSHIKSVGVGNTNSEFGGVLSSAINLDPITVPVITDPAIAATSPYAPSANNLNGLGTVRDANGNPYGISTIVQQEMANPLAYIKTHLGNNGWSDNMVGNAFVEIEPLKGFKVRTNIGAKYAFYGSESFAPIAYLNASTITKNNSLFRGSNRSFNYTWENTASYTRSIGLHNFTALVGTGAYVDNYFSRNSGVTYQNLPINTFADASMNYSVVAADRIGSGSENTPHKVTSVYGRVTYDYGEKYLFTGIIRRDGSSRFGSNNKYGYFPSASVGWVASKEHFWPGKTPVTFFKLRGSYGVTGNDNIGDFRYVSTIGGGRNYTYGTNDVYTVGYSPNGISNPDLKWEQTSQADIGFDASLFRNFTVSFDWYNKKTTGMLLGVSVPLYVGVGGPVGNVADMSNKGYELELGYNKTIRTVRFEVKANISHLTNTVTSLGVDKKYLTGASLQSSQYELSRIAVGHAIGSFYGFQTMGIFQTQADVNSYVNKNGGLIQPGAKPGDFIWADQNGDGVIDANDRTFIGDPTPDWSYGFTVSAAVKGFDLVVFGQGAAGNQIFNGLRRLDIPTANWTTKALNRWTGPGTSNDFPRLTTTDPNHNFSNPSAFYLESGDYFRIKVLQLGYTLPSSLISKVHFQKVRIYVSGNNLVTLTKYTGFDPEIGGGSYGIDRGFYPQARSFTAGINLTF